MRAIVPLLLGLTASFVRAISANGKESPCVVFEGEGFIIAADGEATDIILAEDDWSGVHRAAHDFADDVKRVSGAQPQLFNVSTTNSTSTEHSHSESNTAVIIGTLGHSSLIDALVNASIIDVTGIQDKWETYMAVTVQFNDSLPGLEQLDEAYVIVGSDKRGTIYAMYDHSEAFGVSPWYWWASAPVQKHAIIRTTTGCTAGPPTVKYRGIFLNDEQPGLQNWAQDKFTNGTGQPFNHLFYEKLFELLLRLKANYLWPAMWGSMFCVDDPLNQPLADYFGIVMGTSHQEPMARSSPNEWNLYGSGPWNYTSNAANVYKYFQEGAERAKPYETLFTVGMRGSGDLPLEESTNIALLEKIIADQRTILTNVFNGTDVTTIPQVWTLYKEVQEYYEHGMRVPDDITLLWTDDNWGNIMRFPLPNERTRSGGAGVYYHVDYVGDPRDYKWITSSQIPKMWEQLSIASERNATRIWILNVGDLKPYERETEFFLTYAWNNTEWNTLNLDSFVKGWAQRDLGVDANDARVVTEIVANLTRWNARKKPELLNYTTYSVTNYREAETVVEGWSTLEKTSTSIYNKLSHSAQSAYYQTVHHAVLASSNLGRMLVAAGQNQLKASQARLGANDLAEKVEELFEGDYTLEERYHALEEGKWNHLMDQTHLGYYYWQQPMTNTMPSITRVQKNKQALAGPMRVTIEGSAGAWPGDNEKNCALGYNCPPPTVVLDRYSSIKNAYIDVSAGGPLSFSWTATSNSTMISLSSSAGNISPKDNDHRVFVNVKDWSQVPGGTTTVGVTFAAKAPALPKGQPNGNVAALVNIVNREAPSDFHGFVQGNGVVSIEAAHATRNSSANGVAWSVIPYLGRTLSGVTPMPRLGNSDSPFAFGDGPVLEYDIYTFDVPPQSTLNGTIYVSPVLNSYARPLAFGVALDSQTITNVSFVPASNPGTLPTAWKGLDGWVANSIIPVPVSFSAVQPGAHTFKLYMLEPAVVVQKIVFDVGGLLKSYLGPPESVVV